jgi:hypothetical protein
MLIASLRRNCGNNGLLRWKNAHDFIHDGQKHHGAILLELDKDIVAVRQESENELVWEWLELKP